MASEMNTTSRDFSSWRRVSAETFADLYAAFLIWRNDRTDLGGLCLEDQLERFGQELADEP